MSKRPADLRAGDGNNAPAKRQKIDLPVRPPPRLEEVHSGRQLQQLLRFQQSDGPRLKYAIQSFKAFLDSILHHPDDPNIQKRRAILKEYLDSQRAREGEEQDHVYMTDVMQTWSYASQSNNDSLLSAVPAVLALVLRSISTLIDFRDNGVRLCKTVLQSPQLKNISRGLGAPKIKEHVISPCLRLLSEVVSFDAGALAKHLFSGRDLTLNSKDLVRNLGLRRAPSQDTAEDRRKPSVRYNALRYILANLKYQNPVAKGEILSQASIIKAIFVDIKEDSPEIIAEILDVLTKSVVLDKALPRSSKSRLLNERTLACIATLYSYEESSESSAVSNKSTDILAHEFLLLVCTSPELGTLVSQTGWYPPGTENDDLEICTDDDRESIDLGLDSLEWFGRFHTRVPVRNTTLAAFAQTLRPYADTLQAELLLAIFSAAPELVADYYFKKKNFTFDPKLTATWIGYSAFIFSTVELSVPEYLGRKDTYGRAPPPESIVIESILPQPMNQRTLTKCLNQKTELITFFAVRLMIVAFEKLKRVLACYQEASLQQGSLWEEASSRLVSEFCRRCPTMKEVITVYRITSDQKLLQREAITRLLVEYHEAIPQIALDEKFDISAELADRLTEIEKTEAQPEDSTLDLLELENLLRVAQRSSSMRWWHKPDTLEYSPFTTVLKLFVNASDGAPLKQIEVLLQSIIGDNGILQGQTQVPALHALAASLRTSEDKAVSRYVLEFLDNAILRLVRKPIKYIDDLNSLRECAPASSRTSDFSPISLLIVTLMEQWPFVVKAGNERASDVALWLATYLGYSAQIGESTEKLHLVRDTLIGAAVEEDHVSILRQAFEGSKKANFTRAVDSQKEEQSLPPNGDKAGSNSAKPNVAYEENEILVTPLPEDENYSGLTNWVRKDVQDAIEDGDAGDLIMCLCSEHLEIRKQGMTNLRKLLIKVEASSYSEKQQIYLLLGELIDTTEEYFSTQPMESFVGVFARCALLVLKDPLHPLYGKVNRFLNKSPTWHVEKIPSYWVDKILLHPPDDDDAHYREVEWLLDTFTDGLRKSKDMDVYRIRNVFERLLSLYSSPFLSPSYKRKILTMIARATFAEGSTTLITRSGVYSWIKAQISVGGPNDVILKRLATRLWETCEQERVSEWSGTPNITL
ncbi:MAG: hypothetical protein M1812_000846 [Candelaria pacifica]|nr:MAG: hypothetical protein M1812_000846 [Candelaria pacifica]